MAKSTCPQLEETIGYTLSAIWIKIERRWFLLNFLNFVKYRTLFHYSQNFPLGWGWLLVYLTWLYRIHIWNFRRKPWILVAGYVANVFLHIWWREGLNFPKIIFNFFCKKKLENRLIFNPRGTSFYYNFSCKTLHSSTPSLSLSIGNTISDYHIIFHLMIISTF